MKRFLLSMLLILSILATYSLAHMEGGMIGGSSQEHHGGAETQSTYSPCQMGSGMMGYGMMGTGMMGGYGICPGYGMMGPGMMGMMRNMMMAPCMGYGIGQGMMGSGCGMMWPGMMWPGMMWPGMMWGLWHRELSEVS